MADIPSSPPQRMSRYRSQRRAAHAQTEQAPDLPHLPTPHPAVTDDDGVARSKSRYKRRNVSNATSVPSTPQNDDVGDESAAWETQRRQQSPPQVQALPPHSLQPSHAATNTQKAQDNTWHSQAVAQKKRSHEEDTSTHVAAKESQSPGTKRVHEPVPVSSLQHLPAQAPQPPGELFPPPRAEPVRPTAKPLRVDGPPASDMIRATKSMTALPTLNEDDTGDAGGCFGFFQRKRTAAQNTPGKAAGPRVLGQSEMQAIKAGGIGGALPAVDAPKSAVNAGDRRVLIECGKSRQVFPVNPTTTPADLIRSAATCMSERINVHSAVLLEYFGTVGVQRPLRRYEHVRDVMNSWDTDKQNSLLLVDPGTGSSEVELSIAGVPKVKPSECSWLLSYSQRPGKWDKRLITLRSDGQITLQREPNKPHQENVCHLSDFDVYTPTPEKIKKKIKPPKKICFAVKSQQKTSMFESTRNFVHFFCTSDKPTADSFYNAVQGWRSWYLVNVMGEGKKTKPVAEFEKDIGERSNGIANGHISSEFSESHYQLGSFRPLMEDATFGGRPATSRSANASPPSAGGFAKSANQFDTTISPERRTSTTRRRQQHPPGAMSNKSQLADDEPLAKIARRSSIDQPDSADGASSEFAASGLLGKSYSPRQRAVQEREKDRQQPFTAGRNLLNGGLGDDDLIGRQSMDAAPRRTGSTRARPDELRHNQSRRDRPGTSRGSADITRSGSTRRTAMPEKPLVDLTPQYREPPQHSKKGKGYHPEHVGQGGLINSATSPDDPLGIPSSTEWRGRNAAAAAASNHPAARTAQHERTRSLSRQHPAGQPRPGTSSRPGADNHDGFTGEGLLAGGQKGWGGGTMGRGYMDGSRARGPMLDMNEPSKFAQGSLLDKVDREKRDEREGLHGEGH